MKPQAPSIAALPRAVGVLGLALSTGACTGEVVNSNHRPPPSQGGSGGSGAMERPACTGDEIAMPKRLIRLSFPQLAASLRTVFGDTVAAQTVKGKPSSTERTFPPLGDTSEGSTYIATNWQTVDSVAKAAGKHALDNFASFTGCGDAPTVECAKAFMDVAAERAYRRPLREAEKASVQQVFTEVTLAGGTVQQGVEAAVYAVYSSPQFLYRTELGVEKSAGPLTAYELASQLSYFLTDGPPDADLLAAAAQGKLGTREEILAHVDRLLAMPATRQNLQDTVLSAFGIARVKAVVIDGLPQDVWNTGVANSMFRETQLFINDVLWNGGAVSDLATSRKSFVNKPLAALYGVPEPTTLDADGFGQVMLPEHRSGIITSLGFLSSRARPDEQSVVGRGLAVNDAILCQQNPSFPEALASQIEAVNEMQHDLSERDKAEYRMQNAPCMGCHPSFDPYGLALESFDVIGRFRTVDPQMRPIDVSVTLPPIAGGKTALNAVEVGKALSESGAFASCVGTKLLTYALAETGVPGQSCASKAIASEFEKTDKSFNALVRAVAVSKTLTHRSGG